MNKTDNGQLEIDILQLMRALWRSAWAILLATVLCGATVFAGTALLIQPKYRAETLMYVNSNTFSSTKGSISQAELAAAQRLVDTYIVILNTRTTLEDVIAQTGVTYDYEELKEMITAEAVNGTEILSIQVVSKSPAEAQMLANSIARLLPEKIASIVEGSSARILDDAVIPVEKDSPRLLRDTLIGMILGFLVSCGVIVVKELTDDQIHGTEDLVQQFDIPILAVIPNRISEGSLNLGAAEAYKLLRTNLDFTLPAGKKCRILGVTSALRGEGKSTTAVNIAHTMAQSGGKVLLIEADLRKPSLAERLQILQKPGLSNLLVGQCSGNDILQRSNLIANLWVTTAGEVPPNPAELLGSQYMSATLAAMAEAFDVIVLDLPPVTDVSDTLILSKLVDGMVLVVRQDYCDRSALDQAVGQLGFVEAKILGFVMTGGEKRKKGHQPYGSSRKTR